MTEGRVGRHYGLLLVNSLRGSWTSLVSLAYLAMHLPSLIPFFACLSAPPPPLLSRLTALSTLDDWLFPESLKFWLKCYLLKSFSRSMK